MLRQADSLEALRGPFPLLGAILLQLLTAAVGPKRRLLRRNGMSAIRGSAAIRSGSRPSNFKRAMWRRFGG